MSNSKAEADRLVQATATAIDFEEQPAKKEEVSEMEMVSKQAPEHGCLSKKGKIIAAVVCFVVVALALGLGLGLGLQQNDPNIQDLSGTSNRTIDHSKFDWILKQYLDEGRSKKGPETGDKITFSSLRYTSLIKNRTGLDEYVKQLEGEDLSGLKGNELKAFWINAYNAVAIKRMLDGGNPKSIKDLSDSSVDPYKVFKDPLFDRPDKKYSLDDIEKRTLFVNWEGDKHRFHCVVVCASLSCPDLRKEAYTGADIDEQLDEQCAKWMKNPTKGANLEGTTLWLSKLFYWYADDFLKLDGRDYPVQYITKYNPELGNKLSQGTDIGYWEYDWTRNEDSTSSGHYVGASALVLVTLTLFV